MSWSQSTQGIPTRSPVTRTSERTTSTRLVVARAIFQGRNPRPTHARRPPRRPWATREGRANKVVHAKDAAQDVAEGVLRRAHHRTWQRTVPLPLPSANLRSPGRARPGIWHLARAVGKRFWGYCFYRPLSAPYAHPLCAFSANPTSQKPRGPCPTPSTHLEASMWQMRSRHLLEYPASLSYQDTSFTKFSERAMPALASKMDVRGSPMKSEDTTSSSV